jgi:acylphosphatase
VVVYGSGPEVEELVSMLEEDEDWLELEELEEEESKELLELEEEDIEE